MNKKTVFVGISGGVDSAVSAALLKRQGYEVVGVFIRTWHPDFLECTEEEERRDAIRVAARLDIPFLTFDFEKEYKKAVADYMIREYKAGRTPNPDVMCNREIKFGVFLKKALAMGADFVATGHYAINTKCHEKSPDIFLLKNSSGLAPSRSVASFRGTSCLLKGNDPTKDQSYFLWTLKQDQLKRILFPIGNLKKTEVRKLAKKFNLPVAEKKDSQGICFLGAVDLKDFLKHYIRTKKGKVLNETGEEIGYHDGVIFYTLGERHGFTVTKKNPTDGAYYVVAKDVKKNILYVSSDKNSLQKSPDIFLLKNSSRFALSSRSTVSFKESFRLFLNNTNWILGIPKIDKVYTAQIRYHGELLHCTVKSKDKNKAEIRFKKPVLAASGQSCVIYDKKVCLGGGIIV